MVGYIFGLFVCLFVCLFLCHLGLRVLMVFLPCVSAITQTIKCAHERSVHLFIDSLQHRDLQSTGFQCSDMDSFSQGLCLNCKKGRCNTLGYDIHRDQSGKSKRLFLITRAQSPFKGECPTLAVPELFWAAASREGSQGRRAVGMRKCVRTNQRSALRSHKAFLHCLTHQ